MCRTGVLYNLKPFTEFVARARLIIAIFNNPFMIWGKYKREWVKTSLTVSFQFHHTQMDGAHASKFLEYIQKEIDKIE